MNKISASIIIVSLLIAHALVIIWENAYWKKSFTGGEVVYANQQAILSENLELTWDNGQKKEKLKSTDITQPFFRNYQQQENWRINFEKLEKKLISLDNKIQREPANAHLVYDLELKTWKEIIPAQTGQRLNLEESINQIALSLIGGQATIGLVLDQQEPPLNLSHVQQENFALLASGESDFSGSSPGRILNIKLGASKFQGLAIAPGEEFSFNNYLGEVSAEEGYRAELVVKNQKLIPEFGGGICQVSTTLFRAATKAGLPITERRAHSLPVRYYNPQGFDATIYPGVVDLRFKNDTTDYVIIQNQVTEQKLSFQIFGKKDGRQVDIEGPTVYESDGNGAIKTVLTRRLIFSDGQKTSEKFYSNYKSPSLFPTERNPLE